jgi:hypothetical protein
LLLQKFGSSEIHHESWAGAGGFRVFTGLLESGPTGDEPPSISFYTDATGGQRMSEDAKQRILDWVKQQKKTKHYFNDLCKAVPEIKMMQAKKVINELVNEGKLKYWSSGSTTMYMLPVEGDVDKEEKGMN